MPKVIDSSVKEKAIQLRQQVHSIGDIAKELHVAKSTVYEWTKTLEGSARFAKLGRERWLKFIQPLGAQGVHNKRVARLEQLDSEIHSEVQSIVLSRNLFVAMTVMLYWAEGGKTRGMFQFANTDPKLMLLFITLLRQSFDIDETKFRLRLNLHWYHKESEVKRFWSDLLHIPLAQFQKSYRKKRSKERRFRKNVGGICFLRYNSEYLRERILRYAYALGDKITQVQMSP